MIEDDLPVLERFLTDPVATGPFQWLGWSDPGRWRRRWMQDGLLSDDGGQLMVVTGAVDQGGFFCRPLRFKRLRLDVGVEDVAPFGAGPAAASG
ncbi:hypothetical protein ACIA98_16160 [Streptomyces sp. NPDC051366]|uniref:hypothetical protein n=1 Tax=Streptomyces sp. NPDC051366 TaxID=3365652 RepID=UPI0037884A26